MRCFLCLVPPAPVRRLLFERLSRVRRDHGAVKWVREDLLHVTLMFLGEVAPRVSFDVEARLKPALAAMGSFRLRLGGIGVFPSPSSPRVLWVDLEGSDEGMKRLFGLAAAVEEACRGAGIARGEPFVPHMTLGRVRRGERVGADLMEALEGVRFGPREGEFLVDRVVIMESRLGPGGPSYVPLKSMPLGEGGLG
ncbi:MAG: RNA 2',3'-cyclic phosphodiesterase [Thermanaerothrix sp.]|nr:RNA 2',3'-cyclic phosphodiesterase [Thermanaerothrix sp.]